MRCRAAPKSNRTVARSYLMTAMPKTPPLHRLALRDDDGAFRVVIEANQGSRNKLKYRSEEHTSELQAL